MNRRTNERAIALIMLLVVLAGCQSVQQLTPAGRFDVAKDAAASVIEELATQAAFVVDDRRAGVISQSEAIDRFEVLQRAQMTLEAAVNTATIAFGRGDPPGSLTPALIAATDEARKALRRGTR